MLKIIDPTIQDTFPIEINQFFADNKSFFWGYKSIDDISLSDEFLENAYQLYKNCGIIAYHYTREVAPGYFAKYGLRVLNFVEQKNFVINALQNRLSLNELGEIMKLDLPEGRSHDKNSIWFCYQRDDSSAGDLVKYFGGECIYGQLTDGYTENTVSNTLKQIGNPVVVKFYCNAGDIKNYKVTEIMLATFLRKYCNNEFRIPTREDYIKKNIMPTQILGVYPVKTSPSF